MLFLKSVSMSLEGFPKAIALLYAAIINIVKDKLCTNILKKNTEKDHCNVGF